MLLSRALIALNSGAVIMSRDCPVIIGRCTNCGYIVIDDGISPKSVPNRTWLKEHGYVFIEAPEKRKFWACDKCSNNYAVDLCSCGSGKKVSKCKCGSGNPIVTIGEPLPNALEIFAKCINEHRERCQRRRSTLRA